MTAGLEVSEDGLNCNIRGIPEEWLANGSKVVMHEAIMKL